MATTPHHTSSTGSQAGTSVTAPATSPPPPLTLLDENYPFDIGEFDWVEKAAIENMKGRRETADTLAKEAAAMLTVLLAGIGGSLAYALKTLDGDFSPTVVAAVGVCVWLGYIAGRLVQGCMLIGPIPAVYNQPGQLLLRAPAGETLRNWQYGELLNLEVRIKRVAKRNDLVAIRTNWLRLAAICTPLVAVYSVIAFWFAAG